MFGWMKRMLAKVAGRGRAMPAQAQQPAPVLGLVELVRALQQRQPDQSLPAQLQAKADRKSVV